MFQLFKKKTNFEKFYSKFISQPVIKQCVYRKAFTAAYLFTLSDFALSLEKNQQKRVENAQEICSILEQKLLSSEDLQIFDRAQELFAKILNEELPPRGDWCCYDGKGDNVLYHLFICYGDLIFSPTYIEDYENAPILLRGFDEYLNMVREFNIIKTLTSDYAASVFGVR